MSARDWCALECTLAQSRRFRALPGPLPKLAYVLIHASPLNNFCGCFWYPSAMAAADLDCEIAEAEAALEALSDVGLIDWDQSESWVRIRGWFLKRNRPANQSTGLARLSDLDGFNGPEWMLRPLAAELLLGLVRAVANWNPEEQITAKLWRQMHALCADRCRVLGEDFIHDLVAVGANEKDTDVGTMLGQFLPGVADHPKVAALWGHDGAI